MNSEGRQGVNSDLLSITWNDKWYTTLLLSDRGTISIVPLPVIRLNVITTIEELLTTISIFWEVWFIYH